MGTSGMVGLRLATTAWLLAAGLLTPSVRAQTLRIGVGAQVTSIDPEYHNISPNNAFASMVYGALATPTGSPGCCPAWR